MKNIVSIIIICFFSVSLSAQKSKVIAVFQLIDNGKYEEAKKAVEESVRDDKTWNWPKTYYAKGYLCQMAYEKGMKDKDKKKYELYKDQLYVAYDAYDKALKIDRSGRLDDQIAPLFVKLANEFLKKGEKDYKDKNYASAHKAFEHALLINNYHILEVKTDTSLIYNTALAAYHNQDWEKALEYLYFLNDNNYSANIPHLIYTVEIAQGDSLDAENALIDGITRYKGDDNLVLILADLLIKRGRPQKAVQILDSVSVGNPENEVFPYAKGLAYQYFEDYDNAIEAYKTAIELNPEKPDFYANIGTCYYNKGVAKQEYARALSNNSAYKREKEKAHESFHNAVDWLEQAEEKNADDPGITELLEQLYGMLNIVK